MSIDKYSIADIVKATNHFKKEGQSDVSVKLDDKGRLVLTGGDIIGNIVYVTIFRSDTQSMPTVTKTERL